MKPLKISCLTIGLLFVLPNIADANHLVFQPPYSPQAIHSSLSEDSPEGKGLVPEHTHSKVFLGGHFLGFLLKLEEDLQWEICSNAANHKKCHEEMEEVFKMDTAKCAAPLENAGHLVYSYTTRCQEDAFIKIQNKHTAINRRNRN